MKKKVLILAIVLVVALVCLTACNNLASTLKNITSKLNGRYSKVTINVKTTVLGEELYGAYVLTFDGDTTNVAYSFEKLNEVSASGSNSFKSTVSGAAVVQNGKVTENSTSESLPQELNFTGLSFKQAFFKKYKITKTSFEAKVVNPQGFTGNRDFVCSDMSVKVIYKASGLTSMSITYKSANNAQVSVIYWFEV